MILLLLLAVLALPAGARAAPYAPPGNEIYTGVSDTGYRGDYFSFTEAAGQHVAVLQSFEVWGNPPEEAVRRWELTGTRGMLSISTAPCYGCAEVISPRGIRRGRGDEYLLKLGALLAAWNQPTYIRLLPEMNGHWNPYAAFNEDGSRRDDAHRTKQFRRAWQRSALIIRGGSRALINRRLKRRGMPPIRASGNVRAQLPRPEVGLLWVPQSAGSPNLAANAPPAYWPGAKYVDWVGADIYGKFPNFTGLDDLYGDFGHKPFVIGEWSPWDYDNAPFTNDLFDWVEGHKRAKMMVYYQDFGDPNAFQIQAYPDSEEVMRKRMRGHRYPDWAGGG